VVFFQLQRWLLGLILLALMPGATGLSLAVGRYQDRRAATVDEANAIGTAYLRGQTLHEPMCSESPAARHLRSRPPHTAAASQLSPTAQQSVGPTNHGFEIAEARGRHALSDCLCRHDLSFKDGVMGILLLVLLLALFFGGLGFALHALWIVAAVILVAWLIGFALRTGESARWYRW
jgi:hypothetical protein